MPLPYYSKKKNDHQCSGHPEILMIPEIIKILEGINKRELENFPHSYLKSLVKGYDFAQNALYHSFEVHKALKLSEPFENGLSIWKNTVRIYHELSKLVVDLGNLYKMYEIYLRLSDHLIEGQQVGERTGAGDQDHDHSRGPDRVYHRHFEFFPGQGSVDDDGDEEGINSTKST